MGNFHESKGKIPYKGKNDTFKEEIVAYKKLLAEYNITFNDLTNYNPKDPEIRKYILKIAKLIVENEDLTTFLKEKKQLPVKELMTLSSICRKTIILHKKYIIALSLINIGKFTFMKCYINI